MAENGSEKPKVVADPESESHRAQGNQQQIFASDRPSEKRIVIALVTVAGLGYFSVLLRLWPQPYNLLAGV
jgi:hypothetical protein